MERFEALIEHSANVEAKDVFGFRPVHEASRKGHVEILQTLGAADANLNAQDNAGNSPAHWLAWNGHEEGIQVLKVFKANLNIINDNDESPFSIASDRKDKKMILALEEEPSISAALLEIGYYGIDEQALMK